MPGCRTVALVAGMLVAGIACASCRRATRAPGDGGVRTILVLGDSLSVTPTIEESFPSLLQKRLLVEGVPASITNAGIRGDTTAGGLRRIDALLAQKPDVIVLELGANDGLRGLDVQAMSNNLSEMIKRAKSRNVQVLLCGMELPPVRGLPYARAFRSVFPDLASELDVPLVPFLLDGVALNPAMNGADQIHPNADGARKIEENVWRYLEPLVK
jgi:acyl-CoA thioesterase-1